METSAYAVEMNDAVQQTDLAIRTAQTAQEVEAWSR